MHHQTYCRNKCHMRIFYMCQVVQDPFFKSGFPSLLQWVDININIGSKSDSKCSWLVLGRPVSFLHVGHTPLRVADSGVGNALLRFRCGAKDALVEFWLADWDTPLFTLTAYDTRRTVLSLTRDDCDRTVVSEALAKAVVSVDSSPRVRLWAQQRGVPVFEGEDALFWAVWHLL